MRSRLNLLAILALAAVILLAANLVIQLLPR